MYYLTRTQKEKFWEGRLDSSASGYHLGWVQKWVGFFNEETQISVSENLFEAGFLTIRFQSPIAGDVYLTASIIGAGQEKEAQYFIDSHLI